MPAASARPVTVIVPIYGDLPSLTACVESLRQNVDRTVHRVLLVNDNGPDADEIETALLAMTAGDPGFIYERNPRNLGFVGNCNRAALELDPTENDILLLNSDTVTTPGFIEELSSVLHSSPAHGAVCPRSNNATIASIPFKLRDPSVGRGVERTARVHAALASKLPRYSVSPVAMGFCILIRRELIRKYGLFDGTFSPGYGEENDFCLRIGREGYLSLIAHQALVFHSGARSFAGPRREALRSAHEKILVSRYPDYTSAVRAYLHEQRDPVDVFSDALAPGDDLVRVLIDVDKAANNQLDRHGRSVLEAASARADPDRVTFTVSVPDRAVGRIAKQFPRLRVVPQSKLDGQWDVALGLAEMHSQSQLARLNRTSLRWVLTGADDDSGAFADYVVAPSTVNSLEIIRQLVDTWGRSPVDLLRLRERWVALTREPDYASGATAPRDSRRVQMLRRVELLAPRPMGWAKALARQVLRRKGLT